MRSSNSEKLRAASVAEMLRLPFAWDRRSRLCVLPPLSRCIFLRLVRLIKSDYLILCEIVKLTNPRHLCAARTVECILSRAEGLKTCGACLRVLSYCSRFREFSKY